MLKITMGKNFDRKTVMVDEDQTVREALTENEIEIAPRETFTLNSCPLNARDLDKSFRELGIESKGDGSVDAYLVSVVKTDNA